VPDGEARTIVDNGALVDMDGRTVPLNVAAALPGDSEAARGADTTQELVTEVGGERRHKWLHRHRRS
jgi:hypothetical protein